MSRQTRLPKRRGAAPRHSSRGFVLLGLLVLLALAGWSLSTYTQGAANARQRESELDLLWVGQQYRNAIQSYYRATPGPHKVLPVRFEDLLLDPRFPQPVRHIRKLYADPLAPQQPWGVLHLNSQIVGVYSQAPGEPFRKVGFDPGMETFRGALAYSDWRFTWAPLLRQSGAQVVPAPASPTSTPSP